MAKLNPLQVKNLKEPARYSDSDGLLLEVRPGGSKSWIARLQANGKRRDYGLGSFKDISLTEARDKAREYRKQLGAAFELMSAFDPLLTLAQARGQRLVELLRHCRGSIAGRDCHYEQDEACLVGYVHPPVLISPDLLRVVPE